LSGEYKTILLDVTNCFFCKTMSPHCTYPSINNEPYYTTCHLDIHIQEVPDKNISLDVTYPNRDSS